MEPELHVIEIDGDPEWDSQKLAAEVSARLAAEGNLEYGLHVIVKKCEPFGQEGRKLRVSYTI